MGSVGSKKKRQERAEQKAMAAAANPVFPGRFEPNRNSMRPFRPPRAPLAFDNVNPVLLPPSVDPCHPCGPPRPRRVKCYPPPYWIELPPPPPPKRVRVCQDIVLC